MPAVNTVLCAMILLTGIGLSLTPLFTQNSNIIALVLIADLLTIRLSNMHWHLIHEAVHRLLYESPRLNELLGQTLSALFWTSFTAVRFGHLLHHRTNRTEDTTEVYRDRPHTLSYYCEILGGFYFAAELIAPFACWLPKQWAVRKLNHLRQQMPHKRNTIDALIKLWKSQQKRRKIKHESAALAIILISTVLIYRDHALLFSSYFMLRALLVSYYNNMPHYRNCIDIDPYAADNAYLPCYLSWVFLNFNYHHIHHLYPQKKWWQLPKEFEQTKAKYHCHMLQDYFKQLCGPVARHTLLLQQQNAFTKSGPSKTHAPQHSQ